MTDSSAHLDLAAYLPERDAPGLPQAIAELRSAGREEFLRTGFPNLKQEDWRFTSLNALLASRYQVRPEITHSDPGLSEFPCPADCITVKMVNGNLIPGHHDHSLDDVIIQPLAAALQERPNLIADHLENSLRQSVSGLQALNTAHLSEGLLVHVPAGVEAKLPVQIFMWSRGANLPTANHLRTVIILEESARLTLTEVFSGSGSYWNNHITDISVGADAQLKYVRIQNESTDADHTASTRITAGRASDVRSLFFDMGSRLARHDITAVLNDEHAHAELNGLFAASGRQHLDNHTEIHHARPHCTSSELFKGILADQSRGVFNGLIKVDQIAQKTDSQQTNRNLLLSRAARMNSNPQLEIYADDVKCSHGSTTGQLDEEAVFYLRSRGIGAEAAVGLMIRGFAQEILNQISGDELQELIWQALTRKLPALAGTER